MATQFTNPLDSIKVASPCSADWDRMVGNNRQRHCGDCKLDVYNLSGMTKREAENLIMNSEGRVCARFYRRKDGTVITKDCPVGWAAVKQRMSKMWTAVASILITAVSGIGVTAFMSQNNEAITMGNIAIENPQNNNPEPVIGKLLVEEPYAEMGDIAMPQEEHPKKVMDQIVIPK